MCGSLAPPQYREKALSEFRVQKGREAELRKPITLNLTNPTDGFPCRLTMGLSAIEETWHKGLDRPLETVRRELARMVRMVERGLVTKPLVVVSGGTARNPAVKSRMLALCERSNVPVIFTDDFGMSIAYE
jgi:hypothetical protein